MTTIEEIQTQAYLAVLRFRKKYYEIELDEYLAVFKYAKPEMEAYDILVKKIDDILNAIKSADKELQKNL
jgi:hypothetical protein